MAHQKTKLAKLMHDRNVSSIDIVRKIGMNKGHMSMVKNGHQNITMLTLKRLCKFLDCTPNDILEYEKWQRK